MGRSTEDDRRWFDAMQEAYGSSPIHRLFGLSLEVVNPGEVTIGVTPPQETRNLYGGVHGGTLSTVIDSAVLQAVRTQVRPGDHLTTVELKLNFLRPALGESFTCSGRALRVGRGLGVAEAKLRDHEGTLVVAGLGTIHIRRDAES